MIINVTNTSKAPNHFILDNWEYFIVYKGYLYQSGGLRMIACGKYIGEGISQFDTEMLDDKITMCLIKIKKIQENDN